MKKHGIKKYSNPVKTAHFGGGVAFKSLSVAALAGITSLGAQASAADAPKYDFVNGKFVITGSNLSVDSNVFKLEQGSSADGTNFKLYEYNRANNSLNSQDYSLSLANDYNDIVDEYRNIADNYKNFDTTTGKELSEDSKGSFVFPSNSVNIDADVIIQTKYGNSDNASADTTHSFNWNESLRDPRNSTQYCYTSFTESSGTGSITFYEDTTNYQDAIDTQLKITSSSSNPATTASGRFKGISDDNGALYLNNADRSKDLTVTDVRGQFIGNQIGIRNKGLNVDNITADFVSNNNSGDGAGISNGDNGLTSLITKISNSNFIGNKAENGGAIYNNKGAEIGNITNSDFIGNTASKGSAIYSKGKIGDITNNNFIGNIGSVIYNNRTEDDDQNINGKINKISNNNFVGNSGDVIYNGKDSKLSGFSEINSIEKNIFVNNDGNSINNEATIHDITGNTFVNGIDSGSYSTDVHYSINNNGGQIDNIIGNTFVSGGSGYAMYNNGGIITAIKDNIISGNGFNNNGGQIDDITGNTLVNSSYAIYNGGGTIKTIKDNTFIDCTYMIRSSNGAVFGDITGNTFVNAIGQAIYLTQTDVNNIDGTFINGSGRAIYLTSPKTEGHIVTSIKGNYYGNAGAIQLDAPITVANLGGTYVKNVTKGSSNGGGAIYNKGNIQKISDAIFVENKSYTGGSILNRGTIGNLDGIFINNSATNNGGAIYSYGKNYGRSSDIANVKIGDISGVFIGNYTEDRYTVNVNPSGTTTVEYGFGGGAIENQAEGGYGKSGNGGSGDPNVLYAGTAEIGNIDAVFIDNKANGGGALYNSVEGNGTASIKNVNGLFLNNRAVTFSGGAIVNEAEAEYTADVSIKDIKADFVENSAKNNGGAISNRAYDESSDSSANIDVSIGDISGDFIKNVAGHGGGAISNQARFKNGTAGSGSVSATIGNISGNFIGNAVIAKATPVEEAAAVAEDDSDIVPGVNNAYGGAIYMKADEGATATIGDANGGIVNSNFIGNYVTSEDGEAKGGAIWTNTDMNIVADNGTSTFQGNYTQIGQGAKDDNAIYVDNASGSLNFNLKNGGQIVMKDNIRGAVNGDEHYSVNITGQDAKPEDTTFYMHNDIYDANLALKNTTIHTITNDVHVYDVNKLTVNGNTNFVGDVDLKNREMDRFTANSYGTHSGDINVVGLNLLSDASPKDDVVAVYFAQPGLKENVTAGFGEVGKGTNNDWQTTVYTPTYKYKFSYDNVNQYNGQGDGGYFVFTRQSGQNNPDRYNPAVLASPVANQAIGQASMNEIFKYVFEHADAFTQLPKASRLAQINSNKYALSTDFNDNRGSLNYDTYDENKAGWFRAYSTFEDINLKNGPKVHAITYGALAGFDGDFKEHKHGWHSMGTGYIGYMGSQLDYKGVSTTMNGGTLGYTETYYKGNFWSALTAAAGVGVAETHTMYGKEDSTMFMAGLASKTGYNFEFKEGKYILQPIMQLSYTFINAFDYTNAAGLKIKNDPMHTIQLNPSVRFINNRENGWQPYAQVGMIWNLFNESKATANGVQLPTMHTKPYIEYGIGVQRNWKDKYTAFGQAMLRHGGRNGVALTAGFRWAIGRDPDEVQKVQNAPAKKIVKQIDSTTRAALMKNQTSTRTANKAVIKSL